jgi:CHAT domain-containing protein
MADRRVIFLPGFMVGVFLFLLVYPVLAASQGKTEQELLKALKHASTRIERQQSLDRLYRYYSDKKIDYLALSYLLKLVDLHKQDKNFAALETAYLDLGDLYRRQQDFMKALNYYFEALACSGKMKKKASRGGYIYLHISRLFRVMNRNELAWKYMKKAYDYTVKYRDKDLKVFVMLEYSHWYYEEGDYDNALKFINLSLKSEKRLKKYLCALQCLHHKALILLKMGEQTTGNSNPEEALTLLKKAVDMGLAYKKYDNLLPVMKEYIEKLISLHRLAGAAKYLDEIDDIYAPYYPYYFIYYYLEAMLYEKQGEMDKALHSYDRAAKKLDAFFSKLHIHQYSTFRKTTGTIYSNIIRFHLAMYRRTGQRGYLDKALFFSEIKNAYIHEWNTLKTGRYVLLKEEKEKLETEFFRYNQQYIRLLNQNKENGRTNDNNGSGRELDRLHAYEEKLEELKLQNRELSEFILESPISYKKYRFSDFNMRGIRNRLRPRQRIIKYTVLEDRIYAFIIDKHTVEYRRLKGSSKEILEQVSRLTEPLDDFTRGQVDYLRINYNLQLSHHLYNVLLKDLLKPSAQGPPEELFIIPDQQLFKLPFEALVTGFNREELDPEVIFSEYAAADYVIHRYPVTYLFSLFHFQKKNLPRKRRLFTITAFGDPNVAPGGSVHRDRLFRPLPASKKEIMSIRSIFGTAGSSIFLGDSFTRGRFEAYAPRSRILHIATHFINNLDFPQYSALLFSGRKKQSPLYYAHDIFKLKLGADLVVLSACESSEKNLLGLQGLRGMTASFRHAGARSMIVSMWPVDQHSSELTPLFYKEYISFIAKEGGEPGRDSLASPALALQAAKQQLMKQTAQFKNGIKISFAHPFIWANYILYTFSY